MESAGVAHSLEGKERTDDIKLKELAPFSKMLLSDAVRKGLQKTGFVYPTAIQATSIPMGKSGLDLLVQSKSGTGKTLIFCVIILEAYRVDLPEPQSLIVAPTREIAVQIEMVLNQIGSCCNGFRAVSVIGGLDVADDRKRLQGAKAIVGTPGRLLHLIQNNVLNTSKMRLLVLDEADKMYTQSFRQDLRRIQNALPEKRQTIACSATFCDGLDKELAKIMRNPLLISTEERATLLIGIKQFAYEIPEQKTSILEMQSKLDALRYIFGRIAFKQCLIFAGSQSRANSYCNYLEKEGWPCELISGAQDQKTRLEMFHKFREFKSRIIVTTDLMSRGVDSEHVNLVINLELPTDMVTYLHRIGRAGRFGSHGIAINFVASEKDRCTLKRLITHIGSGMNVLKFPTKAVAQTEEPEFDFWDFSDNAKDTKYFGVFGCEALAPLASQDHSSLSETPQENKENQSDNVLNSSSSIDTNTFRVDSKDSALNINDNLLERPECQQQLLSPSHKLTPESRQGSSQQLPSSNTIDDASSIAADSLRSSQQDISRYQSILMQKAAIPTLYEFLVDPNSSDGKGDAKEDETKKKPKIDLFDDYKKAVLTNSDSPSKDSESQAIETPRTTNKIAAFKSMLIDQPEHKKPVEHKHDIYSDYANFNADENSSSLSQATFSNDFDKATFILSVATPSKMQDSIEEFTNTTTASDIKNLQSKTDSQDDVSEIKHFTSPAHYNQPNNIIPDVVPPSQRLLNMPYNAQQYHNLTVNVGAQIEIPPQLPQHQQLHSPNSPAMSDSVIHSPDEDQSATISAPASLNSHSEHGGSSGFNERNTTSASSGIVTSDTEPDDENVENGYYTSSEENYSYSEEETGSGSSYNIDPSMLFPIKKRRRHIIDSDYTESDDDEEEDEDEDDYNGEIEEDDNDENYKEKDKIDEDGNDDVKDKTKDDNNEIDGNEADDDEKKTCDEQSANEREHVNGYDTLEDVAVMQMWKAGAAESMKAYVKAYEKAEHNINKAHGTKRESHFTKRSKKSNGQRATEAEAHSSKFNMYGGDYEAAHARWMEIYWTQVKQIQDYVKMAQGLEKREEEDYGEEEDYDEEESYDEKGDYGDKEFHEGETKEKVDAETVDEVEVDKDQVEKKIYVEKIDEGNVAEEEIGENLDELKDVQEKVCELKVNEGKVEAEEVDGGNFDAQEKVKQ